MKLSEAQGQIKDGDLLAFEGHSVISRLIQFRTRDKVSHVASACHIYGELMALEAREGRGVQVYPLKRYLLEGKRISWYRLLDERYDIRRCNIMEFAVEQLGKPYASVWQFIRSWGLIAKSLGMKYDWKADTDENRFFCSEYVLDGLRHGGYKGEGYNQEAASTPPGNIVDLPCFTREGYLELD